MTEPRHRGRHPDLGAAAGRGRVHDLVLRVASAVVLAPLAIAIAFLGGWWFFVLCAIGAAGILWEWAHLVAARAEPRIFGPGWAALLAALLLTGLGQPAAAATAILAGTALSGAILLGWRRPDQAAWAAGAWGAGGVIYAGAAFIGPALLRRDPELGFTALLFLFATVWTTDVFAFFCGRVIGGPRLWRGVSPNKTWAGAIGGLAGGLAAGAAVAYASGVGRLAVLGTMGLVLSVLAQAGDLFESAIKRHFGVKDAGWLIPGHGGLMDRLDGFLVAAFAALLIGILRQGTDAPARGLLIW